jgi:hypothetical protein
MLVSVVILMFSSLWTHPTIEEIPMVSYANTAKKEDIIPCNVKLKEKLCKSKHNNLPMMSMLVFLL